MHYNTVRYIKYMIVLILLREQLPNFGHGKLRKMSQEQALISVEINTSTHNGTLNRLFSYCCEKGHGKQRLWKKSF